MRSLAAGCVHTVGSTDTYATAALCTHADARAHGMRCCC
jgi:hypothetical protein